MKAGLRDWATRDPDRLALRFSDGADLSHAALERLANQLAHLLRRHGLARGDHLACVLGNGPLVLALAWAACRSGLYLTPISPALSARDLGYIAGNCRARLVIVDADLAPRAREARAAIDGAVTWFVNGGEAEGFGSLDALLAAEPGTPIADESPGALMLYSSGTTGAPKGIIRPLATDAQVGDGHLPFARDLLALFPIDAATRYLSTQPLYHAAALRFALAAIAAGGAAVVMARFDAGRALDLIEAEGITLSQWVPTMFHRLLDLPEERRAAFRAPAHRCALHGAAPCSLRLKRAMIDWWGPIVTEYYSGTEGVGLCAITSEEWSRKPGSVGRAWKGRVHILDEDDAELPATRQGRILFSGVAPFAYFDDPAKTAARTSRQGHQGFGDIGYLDADGYLFLTDRQDDMIISGGINIYPLELEQALAEAEGVADCAVVGLPDEVFGERVAAFVVRAKADRRETAAFLADLETFCRDRLGRIKKPKEFHLVAELPRSPTGKLLRRALVAAAKADLPNSAA